MKNEFWNKYSLQEFDVLILQYEESREKFEELLLQEERKILDALDDSTREKFFNDIQEILPNCELFDWSQANISETLKLFYFCE